MEKPHTHKNLFLKFLPKAASVVSFQNPPFSPGRDHHHHHHRAHAHKGFSGPINFAVLPDEAREKPKNVGYASQEPTSPKVSCMGQIKYKHKKKKLVKSSTQDHHHHNHDHHHLDDDDDDKVESVKCKEVKKSSTMMSKFFTSMRSPKKPSSSEDHHQMKKKKKKSSSSASNGSQAKEHGKLSKGATQDNNNKMMKVPGLGQMRKFASGRDTLGNFDWTAQIAPVDHHDRDCFSDEERRRESDDEDEEVREIIIPFSSPILVGGLSLEPRKEVNLWKRRTMAPPPPLALK